MILDRNNSDASGFRLAIIALESLFEGIGLQSQFGLLFRDRLLMWHDKNQDNNTCVLRFPTGDPYIFSYKDACANISNMVPTLQDLAKVYELFSDSASRELFLDLLCFKILGSLRVSLLSNKETFQKFYKQAEKCVVRSRVIPAGFSLDGSDSSYLDFCSFVYGRDRILMYASPVCILNDFLLNQYEYQEKNVRIKAERGDSVIDAGACWGDSSLYFSSCVGNEGEVFAFEFMPGNRAILEKNMMMNAVLGRRVRVVSNGLWSHSGEELSFFQNGPGSRIVINGNFPVNGLCEKTISVDDFVASSNIKKIDFIKMDIEGAELNALHGAAKTLSKFNPKLAICIYHNAQADYIAVPLYLQSLGNYNHFYIKHSSMHLEETVLFATA